jgi:hypothetical protein
VLTLQRGPAPPRPVPCAADADCEVRGIDEWERCHHVKDPPSSDPQGSAGDATSRTQDGYLCVCVARRCDWAFGKTCEESRRDLEGFLATQPNRCTGDDECDGYFFRIGACPPPVMLPKSLVTDRFRHELATKQRSVRIACLKELRNLAVCEPAPFAVACRQNRCVERSGPR